MGIYDEIKSIRYKLGLTQKEFAKKLKISVVYVILLERGKDKTKKTPVPSEALLKRIAKLAANSEEERVLIEKNLLYERAKLAVSKELKMYMDKNEDEGNVNAISSNSMMPLDFISRLKKDIKFFESSADDKKKMETDEVSSKEIERVLDGQLILSRKQVVSLALLLKQSVEEYLMLSDYMPDSIKNVMTNTGVKTQAFFRKLSSLPPEDVDAMVDVFDRIFTICRKEDVVNAGEGR